MNYKNEPYPKDLLSVLNNAEDLARMIDEKLNDDSCKRIKELFCIKEGRIKRNVEIFDALGYVPNTFLKTNSQNTKNNEFKGLYIFGEEIENKIIPVYVGISRSVFRRLKQHAWGKKHNECTLAYLKTRHQCETEGKQFYRKISTEEDMLPAKSLIRNFKVVLVNIENDYELYFLEVALAGIFKTKWNSFKTH